MTGNSTKDFGFPSIEDAIVLVRNVAFVVFTVGLTSGMCLAIPNSAHAQTPLPGSPHLLADVLLPGHKSVKHELVFEESELFEKHRLIAAPIAGFSGVEEIKPGARFHFSSKYGTRFYIVPSDVTLPEFKKEVFAKWPNCKPPRSEIKSVPATNPTSTALTTLKLVEVNERGPVVEEVSHVELNRFGNVASQSKSFALFGLLISAGLAFCLIAIRRLKKANRQREQLATVGSEQPKATTGIQN